MQLEDPERKIQNELGERQFRRESPTKYHENDMPSLSKETRQRVAENTLPLAASMARSMPLAHRIPGADHNCQTTQKAKQEEFKERERVYEDWQEWLDEAWKKYTERWTVSDLRQTAKDSQHMRALSPVQLRQVEDSSRAWMRKMWRDQMKGKKAEEQEISLSEISHRKEINRQEDRNREEIRARNKRRRESAEKRKQEMEAVAKAARRAHQIRKREQRCQKTQDASRNAS
jgi:hypothetical protein